MLLTRLQQDIRSTFNVDWTRRSMWNRNYSETRLPAVPSTIIELLSHQNFADMRLGHDPKFKFTAGVPYTNPFCNISVPSMTKNTSYNPYLSAILPSASVKRKIPLELSWQGVEDPLEPTAKPREYIVYTRIGRGGFDNGVRVSSLPYRKNRTGHRLFL